MLQNVTEYDAFVFWYERWALLEMFSGYSIPSQVTLKAYHTAVFELSVRLRSEKDGIEYAPYSSQDPRIAIHRDEYNREQWDRQWWRYVVSTYNSIGDSASPDSVDNTI